MRLTSFPQIKFKSRHVKDVRRVRRLKSELQKVKKNILFYTPSNFSPAKLNRIRIRIFKFSRKEKCNEFFVVKGNKKYVCLNASLLNNRYYTALEYLLHGIVHSFCYLGEEVASEAFCEFVSYSLVKELVRKKNKKFSRQIIRSIMRKSKKEYNKYYRAARKLEKKKEGIMMGLNQQAKNRRISRKKQKRIFHKYIGRIDIENDYSCEIPELEKGFRKV